MAPSLVYLCSKGRREGEWFELRRLERDKIGFETDNYTITTNEFTHTKVRDITHFITKDRKLRRRCVLNAFYFYHTKRKRKRPCITILFLRDHVYFMHFISIIQIENAGDHV